MTNKNNKKKTDQNLRGDSPPLPSAGGDTPDNSIEGECIPSGSVFPRASYLLFSRHLGLAADEINTVLKEIEEYRSKRQEPEIEDYHSLISGLRDELRYQRDCCASFASFFSYGPEHMLEAKRMMADRDYAWSCVDKQLDAVEIGDPEKTDFWRLSFLAFCQLWDHRQPESFADSNFVAVARTYAVETRELSDAEKQELKNAIQPDSERFKTDIDDLLESALDKKGH